MFQKWQEEDLFTHKREHPIMLVLKYGEMSLMMQNQIYGLWVVLHMKWQLKNHLSELLIWKGFLKESKKVFVIEYPVSTQVISCK